MTAIYDAIVIGSGHNGLTCACYLAKKGLKVLVLEKYHSIGGMTNTEEITLPGFKSDTHAICIQFANFSPALDELNLANYGFEMLHPDPCLTHAFSSGHSVSVHRSLDRTCESIAQFSKRDASTWRELYQAFVKEKDSTLGSFNHSPLSFIEQANDFKDMDGGFDQYRFQMQTLRSWCNENFEAEETKLLIGSWAVHAGVSPDDVGGASLAWLFSMVIQHYGNNVVKGGMRNLPLALAGFLKEHKGEIRTNAFVKKIVIENGKAVGVKLHNGEEVKCTKLIASNAHPKHLVLDLLGENEVANNIAKKIHQYELGEPVMVIYLALDAPVKYKAGLNAEQSIYVHPSTNSLDYYSRLFCQARSGLLPEEPFALICNDSAGDISRVPQGKGLMKLVVQPVPYFIKGDALGVIHDTSWEGVKELFADRVIDVMTKNYIPDLREKIAKRVVYSPEDIENKLPSAIHGTNTHGAFVPYQVGASRPIPEMGLYRSTVSNVYLCGSGSHPGPGVTMAPGRNAAQIIYQDLGISDI